MTNGTIQWVWQRFSALILLAYTIYVACFFISNTAMSHALLVDFFGNLYMRLFTTLALLALAIHTWIGMWSITTDYLTERALGSIGNPIRLFVQMLIWLLLFIYLGVGLSSIWLIGQ